MSKDALHLIDRIQPQRLPRWLDHPLLVVNNLANTDKHRTDGQEFDDFIFGAPDVDKITSR